jgi:hypothetical protein
MKKIYIFIHCELEVTQCELTLGLWETPLSSYENTFK